MTFWTNSMKVYDISHLLPLCDMWWLVALWMPSHFMNQCRHIVQWTFWTNSMNVYGMSHLLSMCDTARVCIEVYCLLNWSRLIHVTACHLTSDRPLPEPQLTYCSLKLFEQTQTNCWICDRKFFKHAHDISCSVCFESYHLKCIFIDPVVIEYLE